MLKHLMRSGWLISLLSSAPAYAEMNVSVADASSRQGVSASASIKITVHIRVSATFKLSSALKQIKTETNMRNSQSLILSCNNQQGRPLAHCSEPQAGQLYTLTTLWVAILFVENFKQFVDSQSA